MDSDSTDIRAAVQCILAMGALDIPAACRVRNRHQLKRFLASPDAVGAGRNAMHEDGVATPVLQALLDDACKASVEMVKSRNPVEFARAVSLSLVVAYKS